MSRPGFPIPDPSEIPPYIQERLRRLDEYNPRDNKNKANMFYGHLCTLIAFYKNTTANADPSVREIIKEVATEKNRLVKNFEARKDDPKFTFDSNSFMAASVAMQNGLIPDAIQLMNLSLKCYP